MMEGEQCDGGGPGRFGSFGLYFTLSSIHLVTQRDIENVQLIGASDLGGIRRSSLSGLASSFSG